MALQELLNNMISHNEIKPEQLKRRLLYNMINFTSFKFLIIESFKNLNFYFWGWGGRRRNQSESVNLV